MLQQRCPTLRERSANDYLQDKQMPHTNYYQYQLSSLSRFKRTPPYQENTRPRMFQIRRVSCYTANSNVRADLLKQHIIIIISSSIRKRDKEEQTRHACLHTHYLTITIHQSNKSINQSINTPLINQNTHYSTHKEKKGKEQKKKKLL